MLRIYCQLCERDIVKGMTPLDLLKKLKDIDWQKHECLGNLDQCIQSDILIQKNIEEWKKLEVEG